MSETTVPRNALIDLLVAALVAIRAMPEDVEFEFSSCARYCLRNWIALNPEPAVAKNLFNALVGEE